MDTVSVCIFIHSGRADAHATTTARTQHHCRTCGNVFCRTCCAAALEVAGVAMRVCDACAVRARDGARGGGDDGDDDGGVDGGEGLPPGPGRLRAPAVGEGLGEGGEQRLLEDAQVVLPHAIAAAG